MGVGALFATLFKPAGHLRVKGGEALLRVPVEALNFV